MPLSKAMGVFNKPAPKPKSEPVLKRWACSMITFHDNELTIKFARAATWSQAFNTAYPSYASLLDGLDPEDQNKAKEIAFNCDSMIHVEEIPNE